MDGATVLISAKCLADNLKPWYEDSKYLNKMSIGSLIRIDDPTDNQIDDNLYVLTCYHGVRNSVDVICYNFANVNNKNNKNGRIIKDKLTFVASAPELDLTFYKSNIKPDIGSKSYLTIKDFKSQLTKKDSKLHLIINKMKHTSKTNVQLVKSNHVCVCKDLIFDKMNAFNMPIMPVINVNTDELDVDNLSGISGTLLTNSSNNIAGMVSYIDSDLSEISLVPSLTIKRFLEEIQSVGTYKGLCGLYMNISNNTIIDSLQNKYSIKRFKNSFKIGDKLLSIDNKTLDEHGQLYDQNVGCKIPFQAYIAMNFLAADKLSVKVWTKDEDRFFEEDISIKLNPHSEMLRIPYTQIKTDRTYIMKKYFVNFHNLIFIELNEEIIDVYSNFGIQLTDDTLRYLVEKPYGNENDRIVVLVDIIKNNLDESIRTIFDSFGICTLSDDKPYILPVAKLISGRKIKNIESLFSVESDKKVLTLNVDHMYNLKIRFEGDTIISVKKH